MADYSDYKECTDCAHYELCLYQEKFLIEHNRKDLIRRYGFGLCEPENCCHFKDRSRFVELPCKVGDDVYCIYHGKIERSGVTSICIGSHYTDIVIYTVQFSFTAENIGKFIFFSVEEAEQALKEREDNV